MRSSTKTLPTPLGPRSWGEVVEGLRDDPQLGHELTTLILRSGDPAVFFETCPVRGDARDRPFEFVVIPAPGLDDRTPDPSTFAQHFRDTDDAVVCFPNLDLTATLVVPRPIRADDRYGHLASFLRGAPRPLVDAFWRRAGEELAHLLDSRPTRPLWFSTAGFGVPWLHARIDETPKYYRHQPFRTAPPAPGPPAS